jgi:hypothetical protein
MAIEARCRVLSAAILPRRLAGLRASAPPTATCSLDALGPRAY